MIRVFLIDDHQLFIDGIKALLKQVDTIEIAGSATSGEEGLKMLRNKKIQTDVLITDYSMDGMSGYELVKIVHREMPNLKILTLSMHDDILHINKMINAGSLGYIMKNTGRKELIKAIETVNSGKVFYSPRVQEAILKQYTKTMNPVVAERKKQAETEVVFTYREKQVLKLMLEGMPSKEIANILCMSFHTVNTHRRNIHSKINDVSDLTVSQYVKKYGILDD